MLLICDVDPDCPYLRWCLLIFPCLLILIHGYLCFLCSNRQNEETHRIWLCYVGFIICIYVALSCVVIAKLVDPNEACHLSTDSGKHHDIARVMLVNIILVFIVAIGMLTRWGYVKYSDRT